MLLSCSDNKHIIDKILQLQPSKIKFHLICRLAVKASVHTHSVSWAALDANWRFCHKESIMANLRRFPISEPAHAQFSDRQTENVSIQGPGKQWMGEMSESFQAAWAWRGRRPEACKHFKQTDEQTQAPSGPLPMPHRLHQRGIRRGRPTPRLPWKTPTTSKAPHDEPNGLTWTTNGQTDRETQIDR